MSALITDDAIEAALLHLSTSSEQEAAARATREKMDFIRKRERSMNILKATSQPNALMREAWAEVQANYVDACNKYVEAIERDEFLRSKRNTAIVIIDAWRTEQSSLRAGKDFR